MRKILSGKVIYTAIVALALGSMSTIANAQTTLGPALNFAILGDAGPVTIGNTAIFVGAGANIGASYNPIVLGGNNSKYNGSVIASNFEFTPPDPGLDIRLFNYATVTGTCASASGTVTKGSGATCGAIVTTNSNPFITLLENALNQEEVWDDVVNCQPPTITMGAINLGASKVQTIFTNKPGGLTVIATPNITLGNSSTLRLSGAINDKVILITPGNITLNFGSKIALTGGLMPQNVLIQAESEPAEEGSDDPIGIVTLANSTSLSGTLHCGNGCTLGSGVNLTGAIIADEGIVAGPNLRFTFAPLTGVSLAACTNPNP
jgi:hypothetical protein